MKQPLQRFTTAAVLFLVFMLGCSSPTDPAKESTPSPKSNKQSIYGTVKSADFGTPLRGVVVTLSMPDSVSVVTDSAGAFKIDSVSPGSYTLYARATNYDPLAKSVRVDSGANTQVTFEMIRSKPKGGIINVHVQSAETAQPLDSAFVSLYNSTFALLRSSFVNTQGDVSFETTIPDVYYVVTEANGFREFVDSVFVNRGDVLGLTIALVKFIPPPVQNFADSLIACFRFSNSFVDSSGHGHDGTRHGGTFVADRFGNNTSALQLNGTSDYVSVPDSPELNFGKDRSFTLTMWVNNSGQSKDCYLFYKGVKTSIFTGYSCSTYSNALSIHTGTTYGEDDITAYRSFTDDRWHLIAFDIDRERNVIGVAVDGDGFSTQSANYLDVNMNTTAQLAIGGGVANSYFKGKIDDVRIYHGILTSTYLNELYHEYGW